MEDNQTVQELLTRTEKNSRKQLLHSRIQTLVCILGAVCCVVLVCNILPLLPQIAALADHAGQVLSNLETVSAELTKLDLENTLNNINSLVTTSQTGLEEAMSQISQIDVDTLNQAIQDLSDIVKPLANLVSRFR